MSETEKEDIDEPFHIEVQGVHAGVNPMFGEWQHKFELAPVPHGDGGSKRLAFQQQIRAELTYLKWMYSHEVQLEITLHLDVQDILETSETADLDNYAKAILDGLKGPGGVMFDDTQVQALTISWLDGYAAPYFEVRARSSPDDFVLKPIEFYEMPDSLWYPHSRKLWTDGKAQLASDLDHFVGLSIAELMTSFTKRARTALRKSGHTRLKAFQQTNRFSIVARGYHRSRIQDCRLHDARTQGLAAGARAMEGRQSRGRRQGPANTGWGSCHL